MGYIQTAANNIQSWLQTLLHGHAVTQQIAAQAAAMGMPAPPPPLPPPPPPAPVAGTMSPQQIYELYRPWLESGVRDFPGAPGQFKRPVISAALAVGAVNQSFPVPISLTSALYEFTGAATAGGTADIANLDAFRIQVFIGGSDQIPINLAPLLGSAFFDHNTGRTELRKPWVVPGSTNLSIILTNLSSSPIQVDISAGILQLETAVAGG